MATAIASMFTERPVKPRLSMTGEITLRGLVEPIGGLKEKSLAAYRTGITTILIPKDNEKDLVEIPAEVKEKVTFVPVANVADVMRHALEPAKKKPAPKKQTTKR